MKPYLKAATYEPSSPEEHIEGLSLLLPLDSGRGYVYVLANTKKTNADTELLLQALQEQVRRLVTSFGKEANAQHRFEQFLGALNETLASQVREGRWKVPIDEFHAVVGIATSDIMFLSGTGDLTALFLHRKPSERYQIFNLFRGIQAEQTLPTWEKPFAVVLDGDMHAGDVFCVSNKDLQQHIQPDELNNILTTLPPSSSTEKIRQYFSHKDGVLLVILQVNIESVALSEENQAKPLADVSVDRLVSSQKQTEQLLEDQKPKIGSFVMLVLEKVFRQKDGSRILKDLRKGEPKWKIALHATQSLLRIGAKAAKRGATGTAKTVTTLSSEKGRKEISNGLQTRTKKIASLHTKIVNLPKTTRYLIAGVVAIVFVFSVSISLLSRSQAKSEAEKKFISQVEKIQETVELASGAVIYKDENQARSLFQNALALAEGLPTDTPEREQRVREFQEEIQLSMDELRHLVTVPNPALLGDLSQIASNATAETFVQSDGELFVFASDQRVYQIDRTQKVFKAVSTQPEGVHGLAISASEDNGNVYRLNSDQTITQFFSTELSQSNIPIPNEETNWVDMKAYAKRVYLLNSEKDGEDAQIYRAGKTGSNFGEPDSWISSKTTQLNNAVSFAIDGNIYILKKNGDVVRFANGSQVGWDLGVVDPPITSARRIWTDGESTYLYILEPASKRLIVFEKESGAFVVQYRSDAFTNVKDVYVDESNYSVYLLTDTKLYSIAASHIE